MTDDKSLVPKLRFPGFSDAWEQRKVGDLLVEYSEYVTGFKYPIVTSSRRGLFLQEDYFDGGRSDTNANVTFRVVPEDFVTYRHMSDDSVFHFNKNTFSTPVAVSREYPVFTSVKTVNIDFVVQYLNSSVRFLYFSEAQKMGGTRTRLYFKTLEQFRLLIPNKVEQDAIVSFFKQLDDLIALHRRKLSHLEKLKNGLLQKMFPKSGESYPELRFPGFANTWEQRKLGELVNITTGKLDANAMTKNGQYDFYTSGIKKYKIDTPAFDGPAITIAGNGATVGYMHYADGKFNAYQRTYVLTDFRAERGFLFPMISLRLPHKINEEARTGNIPYIVMDMLTKLSLRLPGNAEQIKLAHLFNQLDSLIALHQRKLSHLQQQKKALLQQMFV